MSARQRSFTTGISDYSYVNENQIDIELKCAICQQPFVNPKVGDKCGHTLCDLCVTNWYQQHSSCPICRQRAKFVPLTTRIVLSQLDRLPVRCHHCNESNIQRGNFPDHIQNQCRRVVVKCEAADLKCSWTGNREQLAEHLTSCSLSQIRPVVQELRGELSALAYQLKIFMDEVRDQLNYTRQQPISRVQVNKDSQKTNDECSTKKEIFDKLNNDMKHTWSKRRCCGRDCKFCQDHSKAFFTCLVCSHAAARDNITAHDYSGTLNDVICRRCCEKYGQQMELRHEYGPRNSYYLS